MADKSRHLLLEALKRVAGEPAGLPLHGGKAALFPASAAGKAAAALGKSEGCLQVVRTEARGKASTEICSITDQGLDLLIREASPRPVLAEILQALQARQGQFDQLVAAAQRMASELKELRASTERVLARVNQKPSSPPAAQAAPSPNQMGDAIVTHLDMWQAAGALDDCPLPELYERVNRVAPLTIGQFHDALHQLVEQHRLYLHPWTGPLYALPQPRFALLIGHQVAYYASLRGTQISLSA